MSRPAIAFTAVMCIGAMLSPYVPLRPIVFWGSLFLLAVCAAGAARTGMRRGPAWGGQFLCDDCKYNDARYCSRPERPNATRCPDYAGRLH